MTLTATPPAAIEPDTTDVAGLPVIEPLTEHVSDWHATDLAIDHAARMVRNVVLVGGQSRNGHRYTETALRDAAALYAGKPVFLDHAADRGRPMDRSTRDLVGAVLNPRYESNRVRGDIQVFDTEAGHTFLAIFGGPPTAVGMSHVALGQRGRDPQLVERIHDIISVDAVAFPATTHGFREQTESLIEATTADITSLEERVNALRAECALLEQRLPTVRTTSVMPRSQSRLSEATTARHETDSLIAAIRGTRQSVLSGWLP